MTALRSFLRRFMALALLALAPPVAAQERQVVYWPLVTDGLEYRRVAYPAEAGDLVIMADTTVVLEARAAAVSWWPITREYLSDVSRSAPVIEGTLEILDAAGRVVPVAPEPYLVWHPDGVGAGRAEIVRGAQAAEVYETYVLNGRAAAEAAQLHQRLVAEHHAAVEAWLKLAARKPAQLPPPPPEFTVAEPEPYHAYATAPETATIVALPAGSYTLRMRDAAGGVIAGSERRLVSFAARSAGVGYVVRPGDRWTQPAISFSPQETIYTTGRSALYIQPVPVAEFGAQHFARLFQPQSVEQADPFLSIWVPQGVELASSPQAELVLWDGGDRLQSLPTTGFRVVQRPGVARGYVIEEFEPAAGVMVKPDFFAMEIPQGVAPTSISLIAADALPASERRVRQVDPPADHVLFLPALLPILIGVLFHLRRRRHRPNRIPAPPIPRAGAA
ncbi:MAG: hypothetical protein KF887_03560 [Paracoccaceae bacterium]|nr:MAG: hypothetical protein KF887_03560 [Paracoccaceae bacterium]